MTRDDATAILCDENESAEQIVEYIDFHRPAGISWEMILEEVIQYANSYELDIIGKKFFGIIRSSGTFMVNGMGATDPETDIFFRKRLLDHMGRVQSREKAHVHSWTTYRGFTDIYDYCSICDEKRK